MIPKKLHFPILLFVTLIVLLTPPITRSLLGSPVSHSEEAYEHLRVAAEIRAQGLSWKDPLLEKSSFSLYSYLLGILAYIAPLTVLRTTLPFFLGIISAFLLYQVFSSKLTPYQAFIASLLMILSPLYIYSFTTLTQLNLLITLALFAFWLYFKGYTRTAVPAFALTLLVNSAAFFILCLLLYLQERKNKKIVVTYHALILGMIFWTVLLTVHASGLTPNMSTLGVWLRFYITDFGAAKGYSLITIILSLFVVRSIKDKSLLYAYIAIFIFSFFHLPTRALFNFILCVLAATATVNCLEKRWQVNILKQLTLLLIACLVIFSTVSYGTRLIHFQPDQGLSVALEKIAKETSGRVLSLPEHAAYVRYFSHNPVIVIDSDDDSQTLLHSQRLDVTKRLLEKYSLRYFLITKEMRSTLWEQPDQGLLLLLDFSESFIKIAEVQGVEVWQYKGAI